MHGAKVFALSSIEPMNSGIAMGKGLTIVGMVVAGLIGLVFAVDLAAGIPFDGAKPIMNIGAIIASAILAYLSWDAMRDAR